MEFEKITRQSLIVWLYTLKNTKKLKKYGQVHYISRKMKYAVVYVDKSNSEQLQAEIEKLHFVREVQPSHRNDIDMTFEESIPLDELDENENGLDTNSDEDSILNEIVASFKKKKQTNQSPDESR